MSDFINDPPPSPVRSGVSNAPSAAAPAWEQSVLEKMALSLVHERRTARRWNIFFRLVFLAYLIGMTVYLMGWYSTENNPAASSGAGKHTALVSIEGVIDSKGNNSAKRINKALRAAFKSAGTAGVVLRINSPGGSPVQSGLIYREIKRLREVNPDTRLIAVVEEICASGGYYVAAAADEIHVDRASLVGSIGVLINGFGFTGAMQKLGVERRLFTAGENKGFLDSFSPVSPGQRDHIQEMLGDIHHQFIDSVREGRGDRLKSDADLFTGLVWTGARSVDLGLADKMGSVRQVATEIFAAEKVVDFSSRDSFAERLAKRIGVQLAESFGLGVRESVDGVSWR
ncbi:MAG: S49 family peptidase [Burkholderiaceae bacterium]